MSEPFRTAQPAAPTATEAPAPAETPARATELAAEASSAADSPKSGPPMAKPAVSELLATYEQSQGKPYVAEYMGIAGIWDKQPTLKFETQAIEGFLREQVEAGTIANTTGAAKKYLADIERRAGVNDYESPTKRLTKIQAYIKFRRVVDR